MRQGFVHCHHQRIEISVIASRSNPQHIYTVHGMVLYIALRLRLDAEGVRPQCTKPNRAHYKQEIMNNNENIRKAYFASGFFYGTEYWFMKVNGVERTSVGFMGGKV
jgi:hypothetical protein